MTKIVTYKIVDFIDSYNFYIKFVPISVHMKRSKLNYEITNFFVGTNLLIVATKNSKKSNLPQPCVMQITTKIKTVGIEHVFFCNTNGFFTITHFLLQQKY